MPVTESEATAFATTSETDFYELLGVPVDAISESALRKAYRKQSIKWHPDKNKSPDAVDRFHLLTTAYDVLSDPATKAAYDNARAARLAKKRRSEAFNLERKRMQEDLEMRENAAKRPRQDPESEFAAAYAQLREQASKLRQKREEALRTAAMEEDDSTSEKEKTSKQEDNTSRFTELDRTVSVRWKRKGDGEAIDEDALRQIFGRFGAIQDVVMRPTAVDKKLRSGLVVFETIVGAHAAVCDALNTKDAAFKPFKSANWASGKEPDLSGLPTKTQQDTAREGLSATLGTGTGTPEPLRRAAWIPPTATAINLADGPPKRQAPSFGSFAGGTAAQDADYENITLMRMREAEKRRLEAEIRKADEKAEEN